MKKIIFILMALAMIFVVFSCDNGNENKEPLQPGTTGDNSNPYEELEKTLTVKVNSIDEVNFSDGEWELYNYCCEYYYENEGNRADITEIKGILTVQDNAILVTYNYEKNIIECYDAATYAKGKEMFSDREGVTFDDENKIISFPQDIPEDESCAKEEFLDDMSWYFQESTKEETDEYLVIYTYTVTTNSEKNAYSFVANEKGTNKVDNYSGEDIEKYIFKKIK